MARPTGSIGPETASPPRTFHSLTEKNVAALSGLAWAWSLDRHEGDDGDPTVLPRPPESTDAAVVVSRKDKLFHLAASVGDQYRKLGGFPRSAT